MINRTIHKEIIRAICEKPVVIITGARQVGKTTLCTEIEREMNFAYISLADPLIRNAAILDPSDFLSLHPAPLIIDEIQKAPVLFDFIEGKVDEAKRKGQKNGLYILTGSESYKLMQGVTESMRGRVAIIHMSPLSLSEINQKPEIPFAVNSSINFSRVNDYTVSSPELYQKIVRGFFPELYDNPSLQSGTFYSDYIESYVDKDVSDLISLKDKTKFINLMTLLASLTGQELIYENLSKTVGCDTKTIQNWVSILIAGDIIFLLPSYHETSIRKQVTKRPKIYFTDTGLSCYLARIGSANTLISSYLKGPMMETYIVNEVIKSYKNNRKDKEVSFYYYRDSSGNEIDLLILFDGRLTLLECKAGESFSLKDVSGFKPINSKYQISENAIICTTSKPYSISKDVIVLPVTAI